MNWAKALGEILGGFFNTIDISKFFMGKKCQFVAIGPSGVGKSRLKQALLDDLKKLRKALVRTTVNDAVEIEIDGKKATLIDTPGHDPAATEKDKALREAASSGAAYGIIFVAAYGYHETEAVAKPTVRNGAISSKWLKSRREAEIRFFEKEVERATIRGKPEIVLTVVNKADIWEDEWKSVCDHFQNSAYAKKLLEENVPHEVIMYCARAQKFWGMEVPRMKIDQDGAQAIQEKFNDVFVQFFR